MAGLGRRTFAAGEVLTAANVMGYLQDQAVMNFAGTAARGSAIASPSEGMVSYLADNNAVEVYDGSVWKNLARTTGSVVQVISATYGEQTLNSTTTYANTGLTATITPKYASSKVLVLVSQAGVFKESSNSGNAVNIRLMRDSTQLSQFVTAGGFTNTSLANMGHASTVYLDSPATTSAISYKTMFANGVSASYVGVQQSYATSTITLMEISN